MANVAILGTGKMGGAMARELAGAGHEVLLWNRTRASADELATQISKPNVTVVETVKEALVQTDVALTLFTDGFITQKVLLSDPEILKSVNNKLVIADMGTSGVESAKALDLAITEAGLRFVDAPVSGSMATIASHQLLVMASGVEDDVLEITPVLMSFSKKVAYLGHAGAGQAMKLSVNLVVHSLNAAVSEALALAKASGIDASSAYDVFEESVIAAPFVKYKRAAFLDSQTPVAMRIDTVVKDLTLIRSLGGTTGVPLTASWAVEDLYRQACVAGFEAQDMAALTRHLKK
jgi:3-hydroxyisobutyrate dehydrogenase-like beta-hydroxyacid dehydrogenase